MMQHENNQKTTAVVIGLASPELIRNQSHGEVKKCETINYRTLKPEPGGIFCQKIFGPVQDYTCNCLKYTRQRHANIVCDRCGVEVTLSKVRRERMGHIELAVPCAHIWFFKALPSKIGNLLDINVSTLERVIYYESYIVTECKIHDADAPKAGAIINSEAEYNELLEKYPEGGFTAKMGAEGIYDYIRSLDLEVLAAELRASLSKPRAGSSKNKPVKRGGTSQSKIKLGKRLAIVESFIRSKNKPEWMILTALPVIAADLRPLVPLEGGRFASSDLNDLYRRVIFRNTRLKQLIEDKTPDVIIKNEMRMLQQAVDALLDNQRLQQQVLGAGNRPLKSLSEMLKGKQGRFRQNLLGKRVDYSGRSVIVCGPELKMHQCGLPKFMALILFEPFIIKRLKEAGVVHTVKNAKQMINEGKNELVFKILEDVTKHHVVLLNRAPTLHRLGIQAFEPVLIEGKAIRISPLVTTAFNADFDGDQMAVHIPISIEAQIEARTLMMATDHIQGTMNGQVIHKPSQEQIAGLAWLTLNPLNFQKKTPRFSSVYELYTATAAGNCLGGAPTGGDSLDRSTHALNLHLEIEVMIKDAGERKLIKTTVGRVLFNKIVPQELGFQNYELNKKTIGTLIKKVYDTVGRERTVRFLDNIKDLGFEIATTAGFSMGLQDIVIPPKRESLIEETKKLVDGVKVQYENGHITQREYNSKLIQAWHKCTDAVSEEMMKGLQTPITLFNGTVVPNSLHLMVSSGARGNPQQVRQLGGMRGLMSKANTEIITTPILGNFKMGLNVAECFISCYGARKGLADTALKTADSGYLTRRLVDVAQDNIITMEDCNTPSSIEEVAVMNGTEEIVPLRDKIFGRAAAEDVVDPSDSDLIYVKKGEMITDEISKKIEFSNITSVKVRSVLTCEAPQGVCAKCYGMNLSTGRLVDCGEAVGIIAAQSIGEPGTQLTMRTFHTGGVSSLDMKAETHVQHGGMIVFDENLRYFTSEETGEIIVTGSKGKIYLVDPKEGTPDSCRGRIGEIVTPIETFTPDHGAKVLFKDGEVVKKGDLIIKEDPTNYSFYSEKEGTIEFENLVEGLSCEIREVSKKGEKGHGQTEILVTDNREHLHVQILIQQDEKTVARYMIPAGATIIVAKGARIRKGTVLAKMDRGAITNKDITGGLPQITSLLEARSPKIAAHLAVMDGVIEFTEIQKDKRILSIVQGGHKEELQIPLSAHLIVRDRERVHKGQLLTDGMPVLQELLDISGIRDLYEYIVAEVLKVYALQGVSIAPKHIEIIVRQMLQKVMIKDPGDSTGAVGDLMQINKFKQMNKEIIAEGGKPAIGSPVILGITRAALGTDSFLSAASFQETTRVLTDAAVKRMTDPVISLKACVATATPPPLGANFVTFAKRIRLAEEGRAIVDEDLLAFIES